MTAPSVALVTGAAQGLGRAIADRAVDAAHDTAATIRATGAAAEALVLDVGDEATVAAAYAQIDTRFGRLDMLVNNAGISGARAPVEHMALADFEAAIRINLTGTFLMCRGAIPRLRAQGRGRIVNMASMVARGQPGANRANYTASKAGIIGLSRVLADRLGPDGITVNCVAPSTVETAMTRPRVARDADYFTHRAADTALGRIGTPADVAEAVAFLCGEVAGFITGAVLDVNGGSFMP